MADYRPQLNRRVDRPVRRGIIRTASIEETFRGIPRHHFLPGLPLEKIYRDHHVTTKEVDGEKLSSSTAPWLMAGMLKQLRPRAGDRPDRPGVLISEPWGELWVDWPETRRREGRRAGSMESTLA